MSAASGSSPVPEAPPDGFGIGPDPARALARDGAAAGRNPDPESAPKSAPESAAAWTARDRALMARALQLAQLGLYTTHPNPRVGCVIARDDRILGEGWHRRAGEPHAEPLALAAAGAEARGATVYVTLEPCCHQGRTPPCAEALIAAGVGRVVCAMTDPNPRVAGQGIARLRAAGIAVEAGLLEAEARALNPGFVKRMERGLPHVCCKLAASLDGRTALASGESRWITSPAARRDVQFRRARSSAILTGSGTVLADDPGLDVRLTPDELPGLLPGEPVRQPARAVLDSRWRTPPGARLLTRPGETLIVGLEGDAAAADRRAALADAGAGILIAPPAADALQPGGEPVCDPVWLLRELARREINEVMLESGPTLAGVLLSAGLVDEILLYLAPHLLGDGARGLFHLPGIAVMGDRIGLEILEVGRVDSELLVRARPLETETF